MPLKKMVLTCVPLKKLLARVCHGPKLVRKPPLGCTDMRDRCSLLTPLDSLTRSRALDSLPNSNRWAESVGGAAIRARRRFWLAKPEGGVVIRAGGTDPGGAASRDGRRAAGFVPAPGGARAELGRAHTSGGRG
jgi:hypothetical protein